MKRNALIIATALIAVSALGNTAGKKWAIANLPVTFHLYNHAQTNGVSGITNFTSVQTAVQSAFARWTKSQVLCANGTRPAWDSIPGTLINSPNPPTTAVPNNSDSSFNVVFLGGNQWRYGSATLGLTSTIYFPGSGEITSADMEINNNVTWSTNPNFNQFDLESVVTHEAGHWLGLDHTPFSAGSAVMNPAISNGQVLRNLATHDITDVCNLYPGNAQPGSQGAACTQPMDCKTGLVCRGAAGTTVSKICTVDCAGGQACPGGTTCQSADIGKACLVPVGSPDLCNFCLSGSDCLTGNCVSNADQRWCTVSCNNSANCGPGYNCVQTASGGLCVPMNGCTSQCSAASPCPDGFLCTSGTCKPKGDVGDRCELTGFCKPCSRCILEGGGSSLAYCRACCGGTQACNGCGTSCASGVCATLGATTDKVCVPDTRAALCESCTASSPCQSGLSCVAGRCHNLCDVPTPGSCAACYPLNPTTGICACAGEDADLGQSCGQQPNGGFFACNNGLACVGSPPLCQKRCDPAAPSACKADQECKDMNGSNVCVAKQIVLPTACQMCIQDTCAAGLICGFGRCQTACNANTSSSCECVPFSSSGDGICACPDQISALGQPCGISAQKACGAELSCAQGTCLITCEVGGHPCPSGTECQQISGSEIFVCKSKAPEMMDAGVPVDAGSTVTPIPDAGTTEEPELPGCSCNALGAQSLPAVFWLFGFLAQGKIRRRLRTCVRR